MCHKVGGLNVDGLPTNPKDYPAKGKRRRNVEDIAVVLDAVVDGTSKQKKPKGSQHKQSSTRKGQNKSRRN